MLARTTNNPEGTSFQDIIDVIHAFFVHHRGLPGMKGNFREFGATFGTRTFQEFVRKAREFYNEGVQASEISNYKVVALRDGRIAVDLKGNIRGIYTRKGRPLAFFRPNFRKAGFQNQQQELITFFAAARGTPAYAIRLQVPDEYLTA